MNNKTVRSYPAKPRVTLPDKMTPERIRRKYRGPTMLEIASAWEADHKRAEKAEAHIRTLEFVMNKDGEIAEEREARIEALERNAVERKHIDATPDEDYPLRILRAYRADCNMPWSTMTDEQRDSPLTQALNALQGERMVILDRAIAALAAKEER